MIETVLRADGKKGSVELETMIIAFAILLMVGAGATAYWHILRPALLLSSREELMNAIEAATDQAGHSNASPEDRKAAALIIKRAQTVVAFADQVSLVQLLFLNKPDQETRDRLQRNADLIASANFQLREVAGTVRYQALRVVMANSPGGVVLFFIPAAIAILIVVCIQTKLGWERLMLTSDQAFDGDFRVQVNC